MTGENNQHNHKIDNIKQLIRYTLKQLEQYPPEITIGINITKQYLIPKIYLHNSQHQCKLLQLFLERTFLRLNLKTFQCGQKNQVERLSFAILSLLHKVYQQSLNCGRLNKKHGKSLCRLLAPVLCFALGEEINDMSEQQKFIMKKLENPLPNSAARDTVDDILPLKITETKKIYVGKTTNVECTAISCNNKKSSYTSKFPADKKEIEILSQLNSPYIVKFYGSEKLSDDVFYLHMETAIGTLKNLIFDLNDKQYCYCYRYLDLIRITQHICYGLMYLHSKKIIHNDIKPGNILLFIDSNTKQWIAKITDFDLSLKKGDSYASGASVAYAAPEVIRHLFNIYIAHKRSPFKANCTIDIYSLGAVVLVLLYKVHPYSYLLSTTKTQTEQLYTVHTSQNNNKNSGPFFSYGSAIENCKKDKKNVWIMNIAEKCMAHVPDQRPSAQFVSDSLTALLNSITEDERSELVKGLEPASNSLLFNPASSNASLTYSGSQKYCAL